VDTGKYCTACHRNMERDTVLVTYTLGSGDILTYCVTCETLQKLGIIDSVGTVIIGCEHDS